MAKVFIVTVSDTRTEATDTAGKAIMDELVATKHEVVGRSIVPDERDQLEALVRARAATSDAVILTGGTGIAPRDQTYEAISHLFDKTLDGFGEAFRRLSWDEIGPRAILSRATAGTIGTCVVFMVPGSEKGARLAARALIGPILGHAVDLVHGRTHHKG
jgi:molybdenum cofactor biosynthesis protein B